MISIHSALKVIWCLASATVLPPHLTQYVWIWQNHWEHKGNLPRPYLVGHRIWAVAPRLVHGCTPKTRYRYNNGLLNFSPSAISRKRSLTNLFQRRWLWHILNYGTTSSVGNRNSVSHTSERCFAPTFPLNSPGIHFQPWSHFWRAMCLKTFTAMGSLEKAFHKFRTSNRVFGIFPGNFGKVPHMIFSKKLKTRSLPLISRE